MDLGIKGRTALVLGAGGGLGAAIALALANEGASIAVADIDKTALSNTTTALGKIGAKSVSLEWDLADLASADEHLVTIDRAIGPIDILINNTGGPTPSLATGIAPETWVRQFQAMVLSVISLTDKIVPGMRDRKWGRIITSASSGVVAPIPGLAMSNSLRLALVGWSKTLSREIAPFGITCNIVLPGRIATRRIQYLDGQKAEREQRTVEDIVAESTSSIPIGRYGTAAEYADAVAFLASNRAGYITGSTIRVDGGYVQSI